MFDRYTERARRVIFFARYETAQLGSVAIEPEHFLLGLLREGKGLTSRLFAEKQLTMEQARREVESRSPSGDQVPPAIDVPLSPASRRVLGQAAEEAERLHHNYIGTEHLLLGLLREERSLAAAILEEKGIRLEAARDEMAVVAGEEGGKAPLGLTPEDRLFLRSLRITVDD